MDIAHFSAVDFNRRSQRVLRNILKDFVTFSVYVSMRIKNCCAFPFAMTLVLIFCGCHSTNADNSIAVCTHTDPAFSETVALKADGTFIQTETQSLQVLDPFNLSAAAQTQNAMNSIPFTTKQKGKWRLCDGKTGATLPFSQVAGEIPADAVVELNAALPFGYTWENQSPSAVGPQKRTINIRDFSVAVAK